MNQNLKKFIAFGILFFSASAQALLPSSFGVKLRAGDYYSNHTVKTDLFSLTDEDIFRQSKIPVMIAFPPSVGEYYFTQWFFDWETPYTSQNMRPENVSKSKLYSSFLTAEEKVFADANTNWTVSADFKTWSVVAGYQWGLFVPISKTHRILKTALGLTFGWYDYNVSLSLCSSYKTESKRLSNSSKQSGECLGKRKMEEFDYGGPGLGLGISLVVYEWFDGNWLFQFLNLEAGSIAGLKKQQATTRATPLQFDISSTLLSYDILNFAYFF